MRIRKFAKVKNQHETSSDLTNKKQKTSKNKKELDWFHT
jgi:hypothetical protein